MSIDDLGYTMNPFDQAIREGLKARGIDPMSAYFTSVTSVCGRRTVTVRLDSHNGGRLIAVGSIGIGAFSITWADEPRSTTGSGLLGICRFPGMWEGDKNA